MKLIFLKEILLMIVLVRLVSYNLFYKGQSESREHLDQFHNIQSHSHRTTTTDTMTLTDPPLVLVIVPSTSFFASLIIQIFSVQTTAVSSESQIWGF